MGNEPGRPTGWCGGESREQRISIAAPMDEDGSRCEARRRYDNACQQGRRNPQRGASVGHATGHLNRSRYEDRPSEEQHHAQRRREISRRSGTHTDTRPRAPIAAMMTIAAAMAKIGSNGGVSAAASAGGSVASNISSVAAARQGTATALRRTSLPAAPISRLVLASASRARARRSRAAAVAAVSWRCRAKRAAAGGAGGGGGGAGAPPAAARRGAEGGAPPGVPRDGARPANPAATGDGPPRPQ